MLQLPDTGDVTLRTGHKSHLSSSAEYFSNAWDDIDDNDSTGLEWNEDDEVRVAPAYERQLPPAPKNVSVRAPPGEDGTLEVSWEKPDAEGAFPIEYCLVEFRPAGDTRGVVRSHVESDRTGVRRTDLQTGVEYRVFVQALSGYGDEPETKTVATGGIPASCRRNPGDLWCGVKHFFGYDDLFGTTVGALSGDGFDAGTNSYTIVGISVDSQTAPTPGALDFSFAGSTRPAAADRDNLFLHVGGAAFRFSGAAILSGRTFGWATAGLDWSRRNCVIPRPRESSSMMRAPRAQFVPPPDRHGGKKRVKVRAAFSEPVEESPENVGEHGVDVEGGDVTSVIPVGGQAPGGAGTGSKSRPAEAGYGFGAFGEGGLVTPYAGPGLAEAGDRTWRAGRSPRPSR